MSGIILLVILAFWLFIATKITDFFTSKIYLKIKGKWIYPIVFILIFIAPVMDEIIGGFQFRALCSGNNMLIYDEENIRNKTLLFSPLSRETISNTVIPIEESTSSGVDITTGEIVLKYKTYRATGGWISRLIAFNNVIRPYTFHGICGVKDKLNQLEKRLNIKVTYK